MTEMIYPWSPFIPKEAGEEVKEVLESRWINTGEKEKLFRERLSEKFNFQYTVAVNNCTAALRSCLAMLGVGRGDEVISTPMTFIATNTVILEQQGTVIFADIKYDTLNIDPERIIEKITDKTKAIMCVHYAGNPCDLDEIRKVGYDYNIPIIEDCAHALGSRYKGKYVGSTGELACFSFQVIKIITCGDGGLIATTNKDYYHRLKKYVWYGVDREEREERLIDPLPDRIDILGFKYNMNDIAAVLGLVGLNHVDEALQRRKEIGERYRKELSNCSKIKLLYYSPHKTPNYQMFPIHVEDRSKFAKHMEKHAIRVQVNNRRNDRYSIFGGKQNLPVTEKVDEDIILIPIHSYLTSPQVERIIKTVKEYDRG